MLAIVTGVVIGLVGVDANAIPRFTLGWRYLEDGVQILPFVAGLFAIPELWSGWFSRNKTTSIKGRTWQLARSCKHGVKDTVQCWKDSFRGGAIGSVIGLLPGLGRSHGRLVGIWSHSGS